jgi:hypothetical protein
MLETKSTYNNLPLIYMELINNPPFLHLFWSHLPSFRICAYMRVCAIELLKHQMPRVPSTTNTVTYMIPKIRLSRSNLRLRFVRIVGLIDVVQPLHDVRQWGIRCEFMTLATFFRYDDRNLGFHIGSRE